MSQMNLPLTKAQASGQGTRRKEGAVSLVKVLFSLWGISTACWDLRHLYVRKGTECSDSPSRLVQHFNRDKCG